MLEERNSALRLFCQDKQNVAWKMHPTGQLSVFGITRFLLLTGKHDGVFVTSTIELQQEVLGLIYTVKPGRITDVFVEMCLVYCHTTVVVEQKKKNLVKFPCLYWVSH